MAKPRKRNQRNPRPGQGQSALEKPGSTEKAEKAAPPRKASPENRIQLPRRLEQAPQIHSTNSEERETKRKWWKWVGILFSSSVTLLGLGQALPIFSVEVGDPPNPFLTCYRVNVKNEGFLSAYHVKYDIKSIDVEKLGPEDTKHREIEFQLGYSRIAGKLKQNQVSGEILCVGVPGTFDRPFAHRRNKISVIVSYRILPFWSPSFEDEFFFTSWPGADGTVTWKPTQLSEEPDRHNASQLP